SNGGGLLGAGTHAAVAEASRRWLETGQEFLPQLSVMTDPPLPIEGLTQFVSVTREGLYGTVASEGELGENRHRLSPLFYPAQDVITQSSGVEASFGGRNRAPTVSSRSRRRR